MADILIRGMEMPKHCIDCPCMVDKYGGDNCCLQSEEANEKITSWDDMKAGCPLHELPEHGDLISREEALSMPLANGKYDHEHANEHFIYGCETYKEWLEQLPVVILSNKEETE